MLLLKSAKECLSPEYFTFVMKYFCINSYFAHPENLLICGLLSPMSTQEIKEKCLRIILQIRSVVRIDEIRQFFALLPHEVNTDANDIVDFINWDALRAAPRSKTKMTPSPLLMKYSDDDLKNEVFGTVKIIKLDDLLCHSQHVERAVKQTSQSVLKSNDYVKQRSDIICTQDSREKYPQNSTKEVFRRQLQFP